jgi:hypothetical protein
MSQFEQQSCLQCPKRNAWQPRPQSKDQFSLIPLAATLLTLLWVASRGNRVQSWHKLFGRCPCFGTSRTCRDVRRRVGVGRKADIALRNRGEARRVLGGLDPFPRQGAARSRAPPIRDRSLRKAPSSLAHRFTSRELSLVFVSHHRGAVQSKRY